MNKSRRMASLQSRALAAAGFSVLQIDLYGCGDSAGDFGDASWEDWVADVLLANTWLRQHDARHAKAPLWLWGLRAGCLLAADVLPRIGEPCHLCFWQPAAAGKLLLQQFLRLKLAADMLTGNNKGQMEAMRLQLTAGNALDIAGYVLTASLARGLEGAQLNPPVSRSVPAGRLEWFEMSTRADAALSPLASQMLDRWRQASFDVRSHQIQGPSFWQTSEIEDAPALLAATTQALLATGVSTPDQGAPT
jgi:exosortase A-associated hydrolase 2